MLYRRSHILRFDRKNHRMYIKKICGRMTGQFRLGVMYFHTYASKTRVYIPCKIHNYVLNDITLLVKRNSPFEYQDIIENRNHFKIYG